MPLSKHFRFCLWWESFFNGGHFSTCQTRKKSTPVTFFLHMRHVFLWPGVISLRQKKTPRSIFDGGRYSSLHLNLVTDLAWTCLRPNQSQPGFWTFSKTWLRLIWSQRCPRLVADFSAPRRDRSGTLLRPLRSIEIVSRGEVETRLQRMCDRGFSFSHTTLKRHTKHSYKRDDVINTHNYKSHKTAFDYTAMEITA